MLLGAGCSKALPAKAKNNGEPTTAVTLTVASFYGDQAALDALIAGFQAAHPQYRIQRVGLTGSNKVSDSEALAKTGGVDVLATGVGVQPLIDAHLLTPLTAYIQKDRFDLSPYGDLGKTIPVDGQFYDLPLVIQAFPILYNKQMFKAAGLPDPRAGWTWDEFRKSAARLTTKDVRGFASGLNQSLLTTWVEEQSRGPFWEADDQVVRNALQFFSTMALTDKSLSPLGPNRFADMQIAMTMMGNSDWPSSGSQTGLDWDVAPLPTVPGSANEVPVEPWTYGIAASSEHPDAAWEFLKYAAGEAGAQVIAKLGFIPAYNTDAVKNSMAAGSGPNGVKELPNYQWSMYPRTTSRDSAYQIADAQNEAARAVINFNRPWEDVFAEYQLKVQAIRARSGN